MLTFILIIAMAIGFYTGVRRGLVLQVVLSVGFLISFNFAKKYYLTLGKKLELLVPYPTPTAESKLVFFKGETVFQLDQAFYAGLAFILILAIGWLATRFIGLLAHNLTFVPLVKEANLLGGGLLSLAMVYLACFFVLLMMSMVPVDFIQNLFKESGLARFMVDRTPYFSKQVLGLWLNAIK